MLDYRYNTFVVLVETKSYTKTAKEINFTQPAVTKHIQYIEKELNTNLVLYQDNKLTITQEGMYLYQEIKRIQTDINKVQAHLVNDTSLKIGSSKTIGEYILSDIISEYTTNFDSSNVSILVDNTTALLELLTQRKIDLALISGPIPEKEFESKIFLEDRILLICSNNHPLANKTVDFNQLSSETFLFREAGSGITEAVTNKLKDLSLDFSETKNKRVVGNINIIKNMVKKNEGISFIYESSVKTCIDNGNLSIITVNNFEPIQPFYVIKNHGQTLSPSSKYFLNLLITKKGFHQN
ncbi:LysR family transcriptional regulator [Vagococcus sp.]|uniref:LysR family transcriptional regulator n=1 Tax=Vagococcus sp. TaxID=1933889 RepID=UPI002FC6D016